MKSGLALIFFVGTLGGGALPALAHGVKVQHQAVAAIAVVAQYESGKPMAEAQVLVYAPDQSQEPWLIGKTDQTGKFLFTPDGDRPGNWEVAVRQGGHGTMVTVPWQTMVVVNGNDKQNQPDPTNPSNPDSNTVTPTISLTASPDPAVSQSLLRRGITLGAIIWGFVGTALFFSKRNGEGRA
ncbi:MAG: carboxypeptidase regulatory-like domain-containing protein [Synechocystis sp.]|nr:carboxypeptidase regulatory-like domain-containing protein [Synechocystis sp.]